MSNLPSRLYITFADPTMNLRVQPDRTDAEKLVVKAEHPEAIDHLAIIAESDIGVIDRVQGARYFITFVDRAKFTAAAAKVLAYIAEPPAPVVDEDGSEDDSDEVDDYDVN
jgi:hypothetical protein